MSSSSVASLDRRTFFRGAGLTAAAILGTGLLGACSSAVQAQKSGPDGASGIPVRGGTLATGITADVIPATFLTNTAGSTTVIGLAYDSLVRYPHDKVEPTPRLAKSWVLAPDGLALTLDRSRGIDGRSRPRERPRAEEGGHRPGVGVAAGTPAVGWHGHHERRCVAADREVDRDLPGIAELGSVGRER